MGRPSGGYTIVEVMIVLAISSVLLTGALLVFHSGQSDTQFSQAMQDISSTIQNYAGQITAGSYPGSESYTCQLDGSHRPQLVLSGSATNEACSFLGRAFQVQPTKGVMNSYVILGTRDTYNSGADSGQPALTLDTATPTPAIDNNGNYVLVQTYNFQGGVTVKSSTGLPGGAEYDVTGIYNNLESAANSAYGNQSLNLIGYSYNNYPVQGSGTLTTCIEETTCTAATQIVPLSQWNLCLTDGTAANTASLQIKSSVSGITTKIVYAAC